MISTINAVVIQRTVYPNIREARLRFTSITGWISSGPLHGSLIALIKVLLNFFYNGSMTFGIGETVNLIGSLLYVASSVSFTINAVVILNQR